MYTYVEQASDPLRSATNPMSQRHPKVFGFQVSGITLQPDVKTAKFLEAILPKIQPNYQPVTRDSWADTS